MTLNGLSLVAAALVVATTPELSPKAARAYAGAALQVTSRPVEWFIPLALGADGANSLDWRPGRTRPPPQPAPLPSDPDTWSVVRGGIKPLRDEDLAALLDDRDLEERIDRARFVPHVVWSSAFGGLGAAALGTGAWLTWLRDASGSSQRDGRAVGVSLLTVGAVSAAMALLYPWLEPEHVLSRAQAQDLCDRFNERLRAHLAAPGTDDGSI